MATPGTKSASKGGRARANVLTAEERRAIARQAAKARWGKTTDLDDPGDGAAGETPEVVEDEQVPYSMFRGTLKMVDLDLDCHVLSTGERVFTQREVIRIISGGGKGGGTIQRYLANNPAYQEGMLEDRVIRFKIPGLPGLSNGYDANLLIEICDLYLRARDEGLLKRNQLQVARMAEIVMRSSARVGIIALIDEATGYQKVRAKQALQLKLQAFIAEEMQEWARMFPDEFWYELARLEGIHYSPRHRPLRWGKYVMAFVYDAVDEDVGMTLREVNPNPKFKQNHHQWLKTHGRQSVHDQIQRVVTIMKLCEDMTDFRKKFAKVFAKGPLQLELGLD